MYYCSVHTFLKSAALSDPLCPISFISLALVSLFVSLVSDSCIPPGVPAKVRKKSGNSIKFGRLASSTFARSRECV